MKGLLYCNPKGDSLQSKSELLNTSLSRFELAYALDWSPARVRALHRLIPGVKGPPGRGSRLEYSIQQVAYVRAVQLLLRRGVVVPSAAGIQQAQLLAETLSALVMDAFDNLMGENWVEDVPARRMLVLIYGPKHELAVFLDGRLVDRDYESERPELESFLHQEAESDAIIFLPIAEAVNLRLLLEEIIGGRSRPAFRRELREHLRGFRRQRR